MCMHWDGPPCSPPPTPAGAGFASLSPWRPCALGSGPPHWMPLPHNGYQSQSIDQPTHVYTRTCTCTCTNIIRLGYKYIIHECITNKHDSRCLAGHSILPTNYHLAAVLSKKLMLGDIHIHVIMLEQLKNSIWPLWVWLTVQVLPPESSVATFSPLGRTVTFVSGTFNKLCIKRNQE